MGRARPGFGGVCGVFGMGSSGAVGFGKGTIPFSVPSRAAAPAQPSLSHIPGQVPRKELFAKPVPPCATLIPGTAGSGRCCPASPAPSRLPDVPKRPQQRLGDAPGSLRVTPATLSGAIGVFSHPWCVFGRLSPVVPSLARIWCRRGGSTRVAAAGERVWELFQLGGRDPGRAAFPPPRPV